MVNQSLKRKDTKGHRSINLSELSRELLEPLEGCEWKVVSEWGC